MSNILYFLGALILFGLIVFVHELGHFLAARATGILVSEFAIGMGPKLLSWKRGRTQYSLRAIPLGGYCRFLDESEAEQWRPVPCITGFTGEGEAERSGLMRGDVMVEVNGEAISFDADGFERIQLVARAAAPGAALPVTVERGGARVVVQVTPREVEGECRLGLAFGKLDENALPRVALAGRAARAAGLRAGDMIVGVAGRRVRCTSLGAEQVLKRMERAQGPVDVQVERGGERLTLSVPPDQTEEGPEAGFVMGRTSYSLGGEAPGEAPQASEAFNRQKVWKRILTVASGSLMNFVLAYAAVVVFLMLIGFWFIVPQVAGLTQGTPAQAAGMRAGDIIVAVGDREIEYSEGGTALLQAAIRESDPSSPVLFTVDRGGERLTFSIAPVETASGYQIGIILGAANYRFSFGPALSQGYYTLKAIMGEMLSSLGKMFSTGEGLDQTAGPVGLLSLMTEEIQRGFDMVLNLIVVISLNLGLINLLPLPALDGGRLVFLLIEAVFRKPVKPQYEGWVHGAGMLLLLGLIAVITYKDILKLIAG